jgi:hypothetical protein
VIVQGGLDAPARHAYSVECLSSATLLRCAPKSLGESFGVGAVQALSETSLAGVPAPLKKLGVAIRAIQWLTSCWFARFLLYRASSTFTQGGAAMPEYDRSNPEPDACICCGAEVKEPMIVIDWQEPATFVGPEGNKPIVDETTSCFCSYSCLDKAARMSSELELGEPKAVVLRALDDMLKMMGGEVGDHPVRRITFRALTVELKEARHAEEN